MKHGIHLAGGTSQQIMPVLALDLAGCTAGHTHAVKNGRVGLGCLLVKISFRDPVSLAHNDTPFFKTPRHVDLVDKWQCGASSIPISRQF